MAKSAILFVSACFGSSLFADEFAGSFERASLVASSASKSLSNVHVTKAYALGINRFDLDHQTEIMGWKVAEKWYLGRQDGLDSGLTLVWQQAANQVSFSKDGVRLTRRF